MDILSKEDLNKLTIVKIKDYAKKHEIKGISNKNKQELITYIFDNINAKHERESINDLCTNVFEKINSGDNDNINEIINNHIDQITEDIKDLDVKDNYQPKLYKYDFDYINKSFDTELIESLLKHKLNIGDIVQFEQYRANGCFVVGEYHFIKCSGFISSDIYIPLEISEKFQDPITLYKDIHVDFYGIELSKEDKYINDKLGCFDAPEDWKYYYVNQEIFKDEIHIDIGQTDFIQIIFNLNDNCNKYIKFVNSIDYVKKCYTIYKSECENYGLYVSLKNKNDEDLTIEEENYIYNMEIPDFCVVSIDFQCDFYYICFSYPRIEKTKMIEFINNYYFENNRDFVEDIEPVIDE